jgi:hypothetical protein
MRHVSFLWQKMSDKEKEIYTIKADQDRERFDSERKEYNSKLTLLKITMGNKVAVAGDSNESRANVLATDRRR